MHYKPQGVSLDLGFYFMNYHDKMPVMKLLSGGQLQWEFLENRKMYGVSTNFPLGNWAVGWELSYRPKDAVALTGCYGAGGPLDGITNPVAGIDCPMYIDRKKYQMHLTGLLLLTPGDHGWFLDLLNADTATFLGEAVMTRYSGVNPNRRYDRTIENGQADPKQSNINASNIGKVMGFPGLRDGWGCAGDGSRGRSPSRSFAPDRSGGSG